MFAELSVAIIECAGHNAGVAYARCTMHNYSDQHFIQVLHVTKDELRAELERQAERYKDVYGGEVTTYAAQPEPERKPWRKRASVRDQAFSQELERMEKEQRSDAP